MVGLSQFAISTYVDHIIVVKVLSFKAPPPDTVELRRQVSVRLAG